MTREPEIAARPLRSALYVPGSRPRAIAKARSLPVDVVLLDLEDAVVPAAKPAARDVVVAALGEGGFGPRHRVVRINGLDTEWGEADLAAVTAAPCDAVLVPKVRRPADVAAVVERLGIGRPVWAMMETPEGIVNAAEIARSSGLGALVLGTNDLAKELGCRVRADRLPLMQALQTCILAARAAGVACIDGVYNAFRDADGLRAECEQGRDLGFDGKTLIHPAQAATANAVFAPSAEEATLARRQIAAWSEAESAGQGVAVLDGQIVEALHVDTAHRVLAKLEAIARAEGG